MVDVLEQLQSFPSEKRKTQFSCEFLLYSHITSTLLLFYSLITPDVWGFPWPSNLTQLWHYLPGYGVRPHSWRLSLTRLLSLPTSDANHKLRFYIYIAQGTEKAMAPPSSTLAWKIPQTEEPGGLQSMGSWRVGHDWATSLSLFTFMHRRRKRQPTPVFLPGESQGRGSLVGCRLCGHTQSDTTEATWQQQKEIYSILHNGLYGKRI